MSIWWEQHGAVELPLLSMLYGLGPRDVNLTPEHGGLTWPQLAAYLDAKDDVPDVVLGAVRLVGDSK